MLKIKIVYHFNSLNTISSGHLAFVKMKVNKGLANHKRHRIGTLLFVTMVICSSYTSCSRRVSLYELFPKEVVELEKATAEFETYGNVEELYCDDSILITYNSGIDCLFTMYDLNTGMPVNQFGRIGHGHNEIPIGCTGGIFNSKLIVFKDANKMLATFSLSVPARNLTADSIISYRLDETMLSGIVPVDSILYLGMGTYNWKMHYVLFDTEGTIYDKAVPIYNADDNRYNMFTKFLSNQGRIIKHPKDLKYVGVTYHSGIIDFIRICDNRIIHQKSYNQILPSWKIIQEENMNCVLWNDQTINGFMDLSGNEQFVFALYSETTMNERPSLSDIILVFDWEGRPKHILKLDTFCQHIAVNNSSLYTLSEDKDGNQHVNVYKIDKLFNR